MLPVISGQCACGKASWSSTSAPEHLDFCYCSTCQQNSGAPFASWIGVAKSAISWIGSISSWRPTIFDGEISVSERTFCAECGSCLAIQYDLYTEKTHLAAGTVIQGGGSIPPVCMHIWLKSAPVWYHVSDDGVPRYQEFPNDFEKALEAHLKRRV